MDAAGRIRVLLEAKLSPRPSLSGVRRHGDNSCWYDGVNVTSSNFLATKNSQEFCEFPSRKLSEQVMIPSTATMDCCWQNSRTVRGKVCHPRPFPLSGVRRHGDNSWAGYYFFCMQQLDAIDGRESGYFIITFHSKTIES
nr:probable amino-acid acetyltransferase NAGS1, chloroplastic isoform X1 [Ipomoea batatas]